MNEAELGGFIALAIALGVWIGTAICMYFKDGFSVKNELNFIAIAQTTLFPVALIPQIIVNSENEKNISEYYSPFFLLAYPTSVTLDIWNQITMKKHNQLPENGTATFVGMSLRLLFYIIWLGQFAQQWSLYLYIFLGLFSVLMIYFVYTFWFGENQRKQANDFSLF